MYFNRNNSVALRTKQDWTKLIRLPYLLNTNMEIFKQLYRVLQKDGLNILQLHKNLQMLYQIIKFL